MKAAVLRDYYNLAIEEVPEPEPEPNEVKIRVVATGICGSEMHAYKGTHPFRHPPAILGHEMAGDVVALGAEVKQLAVGDRVTIDPQKVCGVCDDCRTGHPNYCPRKIMLGVREWMGSFGEYIVCPESQVYRLPNHVSYYDGSMVEPLAVGVHAVRQAGIGPNSSVLELGGGAIGLSVMAAAIDAGATTTIVTDVLDFNLEVARKLGATATVNVRCQDVNQVVAEVTGGKGVDAALVTIGLSVVVNQAVRAVRKRGKVVLIAIFEEPISIEDSFAVISGERALVGSQTYNPQDVQDALDLICSGQVDVGAMITHCLPIDQIQHAFEIVDKRLQDCIKVILKH